MIRRHISTTERTRIWERFNRTCQMCFQPTDIGGVDFDHHIPLAISGDDTEDNLRPLCRPCHRLKTKGDASDIARARQREASSRGLKAPSRNPLPCSRNSRFKKKMNGQVVLR